MLNIPGHKRNAIKTTLRFHFTPVTIGLSRTQKPINVGNDVGIKNHSYTVGGHIN
jgi:hypothetical protein